MNKVYVTQNIAEPMWMRFFQQIKKGNMKVSYYENLDELITLANAEDSKMVSVITNKALLNEINAKTGLDLSLNTGDLRAEVLYKEGEKFMICCISTSNLNDLYKYSKLEELPEGVNLQMMTYEFN